MTAAPRRLSLSFAASLLLAIPLAGCGGGDTAQNKTPANNPPANAAAKQVAQASTPAPIPAPAIPSAKGERLVGLPPGGSRAAMPTPGPDRRVRPDTGADRPARPSFDRPPEDDGPPFDGPRSGGPRPAGPRTFPRNPAVPENEPQHLFDFAKVPTPGAAVVQSIVDQTWVSDEFYAAAVFRPQRVLKSKLLAPLPADLIPTLIKEAQGGRRGGDPMMDAVVENRDRFEKLTIYVGTGARPYERQFGGRPDGFGGRMYVGDEDRKTQQVVDSVGLFFAVLQLSEPIPELTENFPPELKPRFVLNDRTIVLSDAVTLYRLYSGRTKPGLLPAQVKAIPADKAIVAISTSDAQLPTKLESLSQAMGKDAMTKLMPVVEFLKSLKAGKVEVDLDAPNLIAANLTLADATTAKQWSDLATAGLGMLKGPYDQLKTAMQDSGREIPEIAKQALSVADQAFAGTKVQATGTALAVSLASPADLPKLVGMLPKVLAEAQQVTQKIERLGNLSQITHAAFHYEGAYNYFPGNIVDTAGKPLLSWRVAILPFTGEKELFDQFHRDEAWDSPHNIKLLEKMPEMFMRDKKQVDRTKTRYQVAIGPGTPYSLPGKLRPSQIKDGPENTIFIVEVGEDKAVPWTKPEDFAFDPADPWKSVGKVDDGLPVSSFDGRRFILPSTITAPMLKAMFQADDGAKVELPK